MKQATTEPSYQKARRHLFPETEVLKSD